MRIFAGLGNPGTKYENNRHNVGFMAMDRIIRRHGGFSAPKAQFHSIAQMGRLDGQKLLILKPQTYMNESGRAVGEALRFYKLESSALTVFYDELDLAPGKVKARLGGGAAGHNGIRSLIDYLGTPDFARVRLGIGHPGDKALVQAHVLGDFAKTDQAWLVPLLDAVADAAPWLMKPDLPRFMTDIAQLLSDQ